MKSFSRVVKARIPTAAITILVFPFVGCTAKITPRDIQGEWVSPAAPFYMNVRGDSISYAGFPYMFGRWDSSGYTPMDIGPPPIPRVYDPSPFYLFTIGSHEELILYPPELPIDTLGILCRQDDAMFIKRLGRTRNVPISRMIEDTTVHLKKIQYSSIPGLGFGPAYDFELRRGLFSIVEPKGLHIPELFPVARETFVASLSDSVFLECQRIIQKASIRTPKEIFERMGSGSADGPEYALTVFYNDSSKTFRGIAPDLYPLLKYLVNPPSIATPAHRDTSILFLSRLSMLGTSTIR